MRPLTILGGSATGGALAAGLFAGLPWYWVIVLAAVGWVNFACGLYTFRFPRDERYERAERIGTVSE